jgi:hypothetical protein
MSAKMTKKQAQSVCDQEKQNINANYNFILFGFSNKTINTTCTLQ